MNSQLSLGRMLTGIATKAQKTQVSGVVISIGDRTVDVLLDGDGTLLQRRPVVGVMPASGSRVYLQVMGDGLVVMSAPA